MRALVCLACALAATGFFPACGANGDPQSEPVGSSQQSLEEIRAHDAERAAGGELAPVVVAIVDTGVALDHPVLEGNLWTNPRRVPGPALVSPAGKPFPAQGPVPPGTHGWDAIGTAAPPRVKPDPDPDDSIGHGTAVASIVGADGEEMSGVAPNSQLMAVRACWQPAGCGDAVAGAAVAWAAENGARVVNLSLIAPYGHLRIAEAISAHPDTLFVAAAGNSSVDLGSRGASVQPCEVPTPNILCVAATKPGGALADCSNYGTPVDVAAPGDGVVTAVLGGGFARSNCGTSIAAPHVTGVAAVLFGARPGASAVEVAEAIRAGARPDPDLRGLVSSGGIVDLQRSLSELGEAPAGP